MTRDADVVVLGAGVAGLTATLHARDLLGTSGRIVLLEQASGIGGKLQHADVAGIRLDAGADAVLARRPEAVALLRRLAENDLVHPAVTGAGVLVDGTVRALPSGTLLGVPHALRPLVRSGVLPASALARVALDRVLPRTPLASPGGPPDVAVGTYVATRMGRAVVERLVEPLLGGVYAGDVDALSFSATMPQLAAAAREHRSLLAAARAATSAASRGPALASLRGGLGRLPALLLAASGAELRLDATATSVRPVGHRGWTVDVRTAAGPSSLNAHAVVVALPAAAAAAVLQQARLQPAGLAEVPYASVALVTFAVPAASVSNPLHGTGFLVPASAKRLVKAVTYTSRKWAWVRDAAPDVFVVRCSVGRFGDEQSLNRSDDSLAAAAWGEIAPVLGVTCRPDWTVTRWPASLPQYLVGHQQRSAPARRAVAAQPGLALCGAAYDGVGVAACVASATAAAASAVEPLRRPMGTMPA